MNKLLKYSFLWLFMLMGVVSANAQDQTLTVYDGTYGAMVPYTNDWADCAQKNEFIIPADEISGMYGSTIKGLHFYMNNPWVKTGTTPIVVDIYVKEVSNTTMTGLMGTDGATLVYTGRLFNYDNQSSDVIVSFNNNYVYNGGNLLICIYYNSGGDLSSYDSINFYGQQQSQNTAWSAHPTSIDNRDMSQVGSGSGQKFLPKTTFTYEAGAAPGVVIDAPTFDVPSGNVEPGTEVTITGNSDKLVYTTDGTNPTLDNGTVVNGTTATVTINETTTLKAIAADNDGNVSTVTTAEYTIHVPGDITTIAGYKASTDDSFDFIINSDSEYKVYFGGAHYPYYYTMYIWDGTDGVKLEAADDFTAFNNFKTGDIIQSATFKIIKSYGRKVVTSVSNIVKGENEEMPYVEVTDFSTLTESDAGKYIKVHASASYNWGIILHDDNDNEGPQLNNDLQLKDITIADCDGKTGTFYIVLNSQWAAFPITKDYFVPDAPAAVSVEIGAAGAATFSSTEALDFTDVTTVAAYIAKEATTGNSALEFTRVYKVPANTGLIVRNAAGENAGAVSADVPVLAGEADNVEGNLFVAATEEIASLPSVDGEYTNYILNKKNGVLGFYKANNKKVAAGKAYLKMLTGSGAAEFIGFDGEVTAIESLTADKADNEIFDLQGRRVAKAAKGVYIVNGKKVVLK